MIWLALFAALTALASRGLAGDFARHRRAAAAPLPGDRGGRGRRRTHRQCHTAAVATKSVHWRVRSACSSKPCGTTKSSIAPCLADAESAQRASGAMYRPKSHASLPKWNQRCRISAAFPTRCWRPRLELAAAADDASAKTARAEAASSDASANVRDIASAADELSASVNEIDRQVAQSNAIASQGSQRSRADQSGGQRTGRGGRPHRRRRSS